MQRLAMQLLRLYIGQYLSGRSNIRTSFTTRFISPPVFKEGTERSGRGGRLFAAPFTAPPVAASIPPHSRRGKEKVEA
jgi:hypothetical protein